MYRKIIKRKFRNRLKSFLKMISLRSFQIRTKIKGTSISRTRVRKKKKKIKQYPKNEEKIESLKSIKEFKRKRSERRKGRNYREGENWLDPGRKERLSHLNAVCRAGTFSRATILLSSPTILSTLCICVCVCVCLHHPERVCICTRQPLAPGTRLYFKKLPRWVMRSTE